jgi:predicted nucleic acid-binding Zn ribbon protein
MPRDRSVRMVMIAIVVIVVLGLVLSALPLTR